MPDFWRHSGYHLTEADARGWCRIGPDLLRAWLRRPELLPPEEACPAERALHARLLDDPAAAIPPDDLAALADPDARENYRVWLAFRDRLLTEGTVEGAYLHLALSPPRPPAPLVPPLFLDQLVHIATRALLEGCDDPLRLRAGETLFREQVSRTDDGRVMLADAETVETYAGTGGFGDLGRLLAESQTPMRQVELDVLGEANADLYWGRDERHDTVLDLSFAAPGLDAFCRLLEGWVAHFLDVAVSVQPVQRIDDKRWVWHLGLDAEASRLLNDLYEGRPVGEDRMVRLLRLFRLEFRDPSLMRADIAGRPVYLALCCQPNGRVRIKPQNLLVNLPLATRA